MTREALEVEALAKPKATRESHLVLCRRTLISQDAILRSPTAPTPGTGGGTDIAAKSKSKQHKYLQILNMIPKRAVAVSRFSLLAPFPVGFCLGVRGTGSQHRPIDGVCIPRIQAEAQGHGCVIFTVLNRMCPRCPAAGRAEPGIGCWVHHQASLSQSLEEAYRKPAAFEKEKLETKSERRLLSSFRRQISSRRFENNAR